MSFVTCNRSRNSAYDSRLRLCDQYVHRLHPMLKCLLIENSVTKSLRSVVAAIRLKGFGEAMQNA